MTPFRLGSRLTPRQTALLAEWSPGFRVVADLSEALTGTVVLEVEAADGERVIVKAEVRPNHFHRELHAHRSWTAPWVSIGRAPVLLHADEPERLLLTRRLPGRSVQGSPSERDPDTYRQAGALLARFHAQSSAVDAGYWAGLRERTLAALDRPHRLDAETVRRIRTRIARWPDRPAVLVPTHGDWLPRNWLIHEGSVSVIDFGRAELRPAAADLARLADGPFRGRPDVERALVDGYGSDPRTADEWPALRLEQAVGSAIWAYGVGDDAFEAQSRRSVEELIGSP